MYERFTDHARKVMQFANQAAQRLNHEYIGTEHILLGLIDQGDNTGIKALKNLGADLAALHDEVERIIQAGGRPIGNVKLPQTLRGKKVLEYAMNEAHTLKHDYVGSEHILLGLLREQEGIAAQVLKNQGLKLEQVRNEIAALVRPGIQSCQQPRPPLTWRTWIQDVPNKLRAAVNEFDVEIERINSQKEEAVAVQEFKKAAALRDEADKLKRSGRTLISDWLAKRPIDPSWLSANDGAVLKLARSIRDGRRWDLLPTLAAVLAQAGCVDAEILNHLRDLEKHVGQCWVVDLLLARSTRPD
jgi:hypothetical protein